MLAIYNNFSLGILIVVKRRRVIFLHLSHLRRTIKKSAIALLFMVVFALMLLNKTDNALIEKTSVTVEEIVTPITKVLVLPATTVLDLYDYLRSLQKIDRENQELREENRNLIIANAQNKALAIENKLLADMLNYIGLPEAEFVTAKVVSQEGTPFAYSLTVYLGDYGKVNKGQVALSDKGVIGRVEAVGKRYAKIALLNNINSKISVMAENTRVRGMLVGKNDILPELKFLPLGADVKVGDKIVTSGIGGVFPVGLPVGKVSSVEKGVVTVMPAHDLSRLEYVMIVNYGLPDPADVFGEE
ncbi:MAG: rod shape-determining protein MreC [Alphaproteobacteria bacterium]|nr:rod shape-determining protein MreC [Alphaproteobacteria bacterium]